MIVKQHAESKLRNRIVLSFVIAILPALLLMITINEFIIAPSTKKQIREDLTQTTKLLAESIQSSISIDVRERLRYIAEKSRDYGNLLFDEVRKGMLSREKATEIFRKHLLAEKIGTSGYIYCLDSNKLLIVHPKKELEGKPAYDDFLTKKSLEVHEGYFEYDLRIPGEKNYKAKAQYQVYFKPLKWYISATCYRSEFTSLLNRNDLQSVLNAVKFGKTGYAFIMDNSGDPIIHPKLDSINVLEQTEQNNDFAKKMIRMKSGIIEYEWANEDDDKPKKKICAFRHLRDTDWIVASSAYVDEVYAPVTQLRMLIYGSGAMLLVIAGSISIFLSRRITRPLEKMVWQLAENSRNNTRHPLEVKDNDEIGKLAENFNRYLDILSTRDELLRKERQRLQNITENSPGVFFHFCINENDNPELLFVSGAITGLDLLNSKPDTILNELVLSLSDNDRERFWKSLKKAIQSGQSWNFEGRFKRSDGTYFWLNITASPKTVDNQLSYYGFLMDISERKRLEEQVLHIQKMDAIGQLAGGVAHDFNNMLGGIMGAAELIQLYEPENKKIIQSVGIILNAATRASELTTKLLAFSRKNKLDNDLIDISQAVSDAISLLKHTLDKRIEIDFVDDADDTSVLGDFSQLQNVFLNLGINSGHAMPEGGVLSFSLNNVELDKQYCEISKFDLEPGIFVQIEVKDNGCGISPEYLDRVFDPFFTTREVGKGTGLGLAAVYGVIQQHHGAITVYSETGIGTVFHILLPAQNNTNIIGKKNPDPVMGTGTVLVIDDEEILRTTAKALLTSLGYDVILAENGKEGVGVYQKKVTDIDLIILDMVMPRMNGRECFEQIRKINPEAKVILASGFSQEENISKLKENGLSGFISKPYRRYELSIIVKQVIDT